MAVLNADLNQFASVDASKLAWQASPAAGVWRKRLYLDGPAETGRVTSLVLYDAGASFPAHDHPDGEEVLVLAGVFSDETGDWGPGSYLASPEGYRHAPHSASGCELLVRLRQYRGAGRELVRSDTNAIAWQPSARSGIDQKTLFDHDRLNERARLIRFAPGAEVPSHPHPFGEEIYVLEGGFADDNGFYGAGCWVRNPPGSAHAARSKAGAILFIRNGGMGRP